MSERPFLLAVPNASEGREAAAVEAIGRAFAPARLLDVHSDPDHNRSVFTLAGHQGELAGALLNGAREAIARIDLRDHEGVHPHIGALDVAPIVYLGDSDRGAACAEALTAAALIGEELDVPVFLYGALATRSDRVERAALREGGPAGLAARLGRGDLAPDYGPSRAHESAGALLVTARLPLVAFNLELAAASHDQAREIAASLRESSPGGMPGVRAIGLALAERGRMQVSMNVHDYRAAPLPEIVARVQGQATVTEAELVGLAPRAALEGFPDDVPLRGFDPERHLIENALR